MFEERLRVRERNRLTIPRSIADALHIGEGSEVIATTDEAHPGVITLRVVRESYAGALTGIFSNVDAVDYVSAERDAWE